MAYKIAYCAGHGINTAGKRTPDNEREWTFNNKVVLAFESEIKKYEKVSLLRTDDASGKTDVLLKNRTDKANNWRADIYISFHQNAHRGVWGVHTGVETYYNKNSTQGKKLAQAVHPAVVKGYGLRDRGLKTDNLHITRETKMPAILIEGGFMDSTIDIKKLRSDAVLKSVGVGVAQGVAKFAGLKKKAVSKPASKPSTSSELYRVRKSWGDSNSQKGAFASLENAKEVADSLKSQGYKVYDDKGKAVYNPTAVANTNTSTQLYRVRKSWSNEKSQIGAFGSLNNAKELADANKGYSVYDSSGKVVYTPKVEDKSITYTIVKGDTLWSISQKYNVTVEDIKKANKLTNDIISIGQKLIIKGSSLPKQDEKPVDKPKVEQPKPTKPTPVAPKPVVDEHKGHSDIAGKSKVSAEKMASFVKSKNPNAKDIDKIAKAFIEVGNKYNIRGDVAFCQSVIETGWFKFDGGTAVTPDQHNYCGMGVTSKGMKGASFNSIEDGVKAQIHHLWAYSTKKDLPNNEKPLSPRYHLVNRGIAPHWEDLSMRWAMNENYGTHILSMYKQLNDYKYIPVVQEPDKDEDEIKPPVIDEPVIDKDVKDENVKDVGESSDDFTFWTRVVDYLIEKLAELFNIKR